ncbi:hypothetical protein HII36_01360 [Nonomuraea sp. NN258]|uniref:hypothetical protein n=1 Tax=Nonomuraea antri TaxID=2730852 RepID=UPI0015687A8D|nr:hypothetical protein [Nonomuraea antri]NRQ30493.1 hypothetical protein [Nonomuraea antri]
MSTGDELKAAVSARRDLGPDFEDALVESFLDKMAQEVDRRVDERLATASAAKDLAKRSRATDGQRLALAIVSLSLGTLLTLVMVVVNGGEATPALLFVWGGIVLVNLVFNRSR